MNNKQPILCPNCQAQLEIASGVQKGEVITCPDCSMDLEIIKTNPVDLAKAPEAQEDWGE